MRRGSFGVKAKQERVNKMKRFLALLSAALMAFALASAYATLGWSPTVNTSPVQNANVSISVKALEYSGTSVDFDQSGLNNATVWKEITGRVSKDTLVKFPVRIQIPKAQESGLVEEDYRNETITLNLKNATILDIVSEDGSSVMESFSLNSAKNSGVLLLSDGQSGHIAFTVLAIVSSSAETRCSVSFTMGQSIKNDGSPIRFGLYTASWLGGESLLVSDASGNQLRFSLTGEDKFTATIHFAHTSLGPEMQSVGYCMNGELEFGGKCACALSMDKYLHQRVSMDFNAILKALGFSLGHGNFQAAYCTEAGLRSLTRQVSAAGQVVIGGSSGLISNGTVIQNPGNVSIPQTGSVSAAASLLLMLSALCFGLGKKQK